MPRRCARFPQFLPNFSERQISWSFCSVDFQTLTLQLPIQTLHSVAPELHVFVSSLENCQKFSKTSTPLIMPASGNDSGNGSLIHCLNVRIVNHDLGAKSALRKHWLVRLNWRSTNFAPAFSSPPCIVYTIFLIWNWN